MITIMLISTLVFICLLILAAIIEKRKDKKFYKMYYKTLNQAYRDSVEKESRYNLRKK
jgi:archaellum component FlaF (FlaF/FlaG flagellin family)